MTSTTDPALLATISSGRHFRLLDMPLDCTREIFLYLGPQDLLRLVRLCKAMRPFLINQSSRSVWKQAWANFEGPLPVCPPDLTEIQYANLAFSEHCHYCLKGCIKNSTLEADWDLRVRCCFVCKFANMTRFDPEQPPRLACDPSVDIRKLIAIRPPTFEPAFLNADLAAVTALYEGLDTQKRAPFVTSQNRMLVDRRIHARECRVWSAMITRTQRKQTILAKLVGLGWSKEMDKMGAELTRHELVDTAKPLIDYEWEVKVKPQLEKILDGERRRALYEANRDAAMQRYADMSSEDLQVVCEQQTAILKSRDPIARMEMFRRIEFLAPGVAQAFRDDLRLRDSPPDSERVD
ncbi:hypothetical protein C8R43DRAFT_1001473 [Mycena crocata]|nr:hypothetical protein C8R43DRAFT_1001473 [Mycena crocata]